jgi:hypothetical protein
MSGYADELWTWLYEPLRDLREKCQREPTVGWEDRFTEFLGKLNLSAADSHPVTKALAERVGQETDPIAFLANDDTETFVYQLVTDEAARQAPQPEPAAAQRPVVEQVEQPQPAKDPGAAAEQAVVAIGLPAALGVAPAPNLAATLATVLAYRLTGQAPPAGDEQAASLAAQVEKHLAANPVAGGEFYAVFGQDTPLAQQWITHQLTGHAGELPTVQSTTQATPATTAVTTSPDDVPFTMPELAEAILRDVPDADMLTHQEINDLIAEVMAESGGEPR